MECGNVLELRIRAFNDFDTNLFGSNAFWGSQNFAKLTFNYCHMYMNTKRYKVRKKDGILNLYTYLFPIQLGTTYL